jgi:hypothetical protein
MKHGPILLRQVECVQEGDVGVLRKIRTVKDVLIRDDDLSPFNNRVTLYKILVRGFYVFFPGSLTLKVEPFPFPEATEMTPPCSSTIFFAIIRPRPVPLVPFVLKKV